MGLTHHYIRLPKFLENDDCCITSISQISHIFLLGNSIPVQGKNSRKWCLHYRKLVKDPSNITTNNTHL